MHPRVQIGSLLFHSWGLAFLAGVVVCLVALLKRTQRLAISSTAVVGWVVLSVPIGALGARLLPGLLALGSGGHLGLLTGENGMSCLGGLAAAAIFSGIYLRFVTTLSPLVLLDEAAFFYPALLLFGRLGCLFEGCCFGRPAPAGTWSALVLPLAFYAPESAAAEHFATGPLNPIALWNLPLLFGLWAAVALMITELVYRRLRRSGRSPGAVLATAVLADSVGRFFLEYTRQEEVVWMGLNPWQLILAALALVAGAGLALALSSGWSRSGSNATLLAP